ncbi:MAG: GspH/FimT family pseudopilin [Chlorobium sp.]|nr:GspH/FimT family pseudopilin [Chlorobium sp.]
MGSKNTQKGFTLVEVLIVVTIIGILSAIAVPSFLAWLPNMRIRAEARDLYSNIQRIRSEAVKNNQNWAIVFDTASNSYRIYSSPGDADWTNLANKILVQTKNFADGISFGHGNIPDGNSAANPAGNFPPDNVGYAAIDNVLTFNSRGVPGESGYVYLQNQNNTVIAIGTQASGAVMLRRHMGGSTWK